MQSNLVLVHTHFHRKRTGVTRSIENVFPFFQKECEAFIFGYGVNGRKISLTKFIQLLFSKNKVVVHCHRNNEILLMLLLRFFGGNFSLISTRHAETEISSLTRLLLKRSDKVVALTKNMAKQLPFKSVVIGHGVNTSVFKPGKPEAHTEIIQPKIICCAGRLREAKGQRRLLEVVAPLLKKYSDWAVVFVGKFDMLNFRKELETIVAENSVDEQVYFLSETPDIVSYYQVANAVIVPSFSEGFSLVCAEAMACGCNVLATRGVGVHDDMIDEKETGYLFDVNDKNELEQLLDRLFADKLPYLGETAQKMIAENWSSEEEANKLIHLYQSVITEELQS